MLEGDILKQIPTGNNSQGKRYGPTIPNSRNYVTRVQAGLGLHFHSRVKKLEA